MPTSKKKPNKNGVPKNLVRAARELGVEADQLYEKLSAGVGGEWEFSNLTYPLLDLITLSIIGSHSASDLYDGLSQLSAFRLVRELGSLRPPFPDQEDDDEHEAENKDIDKDKDEDKAGATAEAGPKKFGQKWQTLIGTLDYVVDSRDGTRLEMRGALDELEEGEEKGGGSGTEPSLPPWRGYQFEKSDYLDEIKEFFGTELLRRSGVWVLRVEGSDVFNRVLGRLSSTLGEALSPDQLSLVINRSSKFKAMIHSYFTASNY